MNKRACKDCIYFVEYYGNKNKKGERVISNYWCIARNGFLKRCPKQCERRRDYSEVDMFGRLL